MTANRDIANEIYEPVHATRVVSSFPESVPTLASDGTECLGFNFLLASTEILSGVTDHQFELYLYDGAAWKLAEDSSTLDVADFDPAADFEVLYVLTGMYRYKFRMVSATGGNVRVTTNMSV